MKGNEEVFRMPSWCLAVLALCALTVLGSVGRAQPRPLQDDPIGACDRESERCTRRARSGQQRRVCQAARAACVALARQSGPDFVPITGNSPATQQAAGAPTARFASVAVAGGEGELDPAGLRFVMARAGGGVLACYQRALVGRPSLRGSFSVRWSVGGNGRVTSASLQGLDATPGLRGCVLSRIRGWVFPRPVGGSVWITATLLLARSGAGP
jgi:hypothetical protein